MTRSQAIGQVEVFPKHANGLRDIEHLFRIHLLYVFHKSSGYALHVKPFLDDNVHDIFVTRYPHRLNPVGLSTVELLSRQKNVLIIEGVDVLDGTPLLDIKPYVPDFDRRTENVSAGWCETRSKKMKRSSILILILLFLAGCTLRGWPSASICRCLRVWHDRWRHPLFDLSDVPGALCHWHHLCLVSDICGLDDCADVAHGRACSASFSKDFLP